MPGKGTETIGSELATLRARVRELEAQAVERERGTEAARALATAARELAGTRDVGQAARLVAAQSLRLLHVPRSAVFRLDPASGALVCVAAGGTEPGAWLGHSLPGASGPGWPGGGGRLTWRADLLADTPLPLPRWVAARFREEGLHAAAGVPLAVRGEMRGALLLGDRAGRVFTSGDLWLLDAFADQAALTVEHAELAAQTDARLRETEVLYELSRAVTGQLDVGRLLEALHREVGRVLDARNMVVLLYREATREFEVALRLVDGRTDPDPVRGPSPGCGLLRVVAERRQAIRTADYRATCARFAVEPSPASLALPYWLGVPLVAGDEVVGVLALRAAAVPFTEADERLLANIAGLAALAVKSARLFEERTAAYGQLRAAQDQLVRSEKLRALGEMAAGVAHDFNNLLAVILGRAELMLRDAREPDLVRGLETVRQAALDGARTVRRIQDFTRLRRTRPFGRVDLWDLVREVVDLTRPRWKDEAQSQGVDYAVSVEGGPVAPVAGRVEELREVFTNLFVNALEAMPAGGRLVCRVTAEGDTAVVSVADTGCGMSADTAQRVFEPFFTTKGPSGSGLGLSVAWGVVTRHGGTIELASEPGGGAVFTVRLPVTHQALPEEPAEGQPPGPGRSARVLVIDDEAAVRGVLRAILTAEGYEVREAADGAAGLARCEEDGGVDLVLSDVSMPGMSGWEVAAACRARFPGLPVGLVTGWGDQLELDELERHRIRFVLAKPFESSDVLRRIASALRAAEPR